MIKYHIHVNSVQKCNQSALHFPRFLEKSFVKSANQLSCFSKKNMQKYVGPYLCYKLLHKSERYKVRGGNPDQLCTSDLSPSVQFKNSKGIGVNLGYQSHRGEDEQALSPNLPSKGLSLTAHVLFQKLIPYSNVSITVIKGRSHQKVTPLSPGKKTVCVYRGEEQ